jgi:hypothetical protein
MTADILCPESAKFAPQNCAPLANLLQRHFFVGTPIIDRPYFGRHAKRLACFYESSDGTVCRMVVVPFDGNQLRELAPVMRASSLQSDVLAADDISPHRSTSLRERLAQMPGPPRSMIGQRIVSGPGHL